MHGVEMRYRMYDVCIKNYLEFIGRLVDKISPAFELRNSGVSAVARSFQLSLSTPRRQIKFASTLVKPVTAYHFAWSLLTKGAIAGIDSRRCARGTADSLPRLALVHNRRLYLPTQGS